MCLTRTRPTGLAKLAQAGLISPGDAEILLPAIKLYHNLTQVLRLCLDKPFVPEEAPRRIEGAVGARLRDAGFPDARSKPKGHARSGA